MLLENIPAIIAAELNIPAEKAMATIKLLDEGNTLPFIARYRKEVTGELNEEQLRELHKRLEYLRNFIKRQEEILVKIEEQGKLTTELVQAIQGAEKLQELEDIYLPFKQKKRTRAQKAREQGLEPLALLLKEQTAKKTPLELAMDFISEEKGITSPELALGGAMDIMAEAISEDILLKNTLRHILWQKSTIITSIEEEKSSLEEANVFLMYKNYQEPVRTLPSHRILAINRGEGKNILKVKFLLPEEEILLLLKKRYWLGKPHFEEIISDICKDSWKRLLEPSLIREIRNRLTEEAEKQAIHIFGSNLRQLLLQPPLAGHIVMGLDPGYRTGCKMAIIDATGKVLHHDVLYLTHGEAKAKLSRDKVLKLIRKFQVTLISIGNGTASFETESFIASLIEEESLSAHYIITNEAGASVYSASPLAREEMPELDVTIRGAVSIARRIQDPLAELVKIDPKAIGIGQYQHDVNQKNLSDTLDAAIESAVNHVGVELNTASPTLLQHIAGISSSLAKNIIAFRQEHGPFKNRQELLQVPRLGKSAFTQCAGFLRIQGGSCPLDSTQVHPESYGLAEKILSFIQKEPSALLNKEELSYIQEALEKIAPEKLAQELSAGLPTVKDILHALMLPGRDPREDLPVPLTRTKMLTISDLKLDTIIQGTIRNITDFGAFVDIGLKTAGLVHISEMSNKRIKHPLDIVAVGDVLSFRIISLDEKRNRIGLSLKNVEKEFVS